VIRCLSIVAPLAVLAAAGSLPARGQAPETATVTTIVVNGRGFGHGIGMSQWGAFGLARDGAPYDGILYHYYPGTTLGVAPATQLRVLLAERKRIRIGSAAGLSVLDGAGIVHQVPAGSYVLTTDLALPIGPAQPLQPPQQLSGPLTFTPRGAPVEVGRRPYRDAVQVQIVGNRLQAVNVVGLESYVRGVVNEEMPEEWPLEALKAQAVAARSYAISQRQLGQILYADVRSQVYGGIAAETPAGDEAAVETRRQVLLYDGSVANTWYFSSSGGRTVDYTEVYPDEEPVPYLVSVADPSDSVSPYHRWGPVLFRRADVAKKLGVQGLTDVRSRPSSGRTTQIEAIGASGTVVLDAPSVRFALGLRSTWFRFGVVELSRAAGPVVPGTAVTITGSVRRLRGPFALEQRAAGGVWEAGPPIEPLADGTFAAVVTLSVTTKIRLVAGTVKSRALRVAVGTVP
jgi:stage II sporulation protein D